MGDSGSMNLDLGVSLGVTLDGAGLQELSNTIKEISKGKDLQRYWKDVELATDNASKAIERYSKNVNSKNYAENLLKQINALKALTKKENLLELFPNMELNLDELVESAKKIVPQINSQFSVDSFSQAFKTFDLLKEKSIDLTEVFRKLADYADLVSRNSELSRENSQFRELIGDSDAKEVKSKLSEIKKLRDEAENIFESFLKVNNVERTDDWGDERFSEYFNEIRDGSLTATEAITRFKTEYAYLLEEGFKSNNDTFGLEQLQAFSNKLDSIFRQVEETSNKINDIISNGVLTKSVENLSVDSSLTDSQRSLFGNLLKDEESLKSITALFQKLIEESNKTKNSELFNSEQLQQVLSIFDRIENSLSSLRSVISDVGDGEEFSPLLKMINNVQSTIFELSTSVKGIGLNMNIDVGSDGELDRKLQSKVANALQAYQKLFNNIKMSSAGGAFINQEFFDFNLDDYDTAYQKLKAIVNFIKKQRDEAKKQFNGYDALYEDSDKSLWKSAQAYLAQVTKAETEIKKVNSGESNPLENLFGNTKDLSGVIEQLDKIVTKLEEISTTASSFKEVFTNGFNVTASVEEIDKLTNRVKELEDELSKIKLSPVGVDKSNISSENSSLSQLNKEQKELDEIAIKLQEIKEIENKIASKKELGEDFRMLKLDLDLAKQKLKDLTAVKLQEELKDILGTTDIWYRRVKSMSELLANTGGYFSNSLLSASSYFDVSDYRQQMIAGQIDTSKFFKLDAQGNQWNSLEKVFAESELGQKFKELGISVDEFIEKYHIRVDLGAKYTTEFVANVAKELGYLGIIFENINDNSIFNADGTILPATTTSVQVFDSSALSNVKNITNLLLGTSNIIEDINNEELAKTQKVGGDLISQITKVQQKLIELRKTTDGKGTSTSKLENIKQILLEIQSVDFKNLDKISQEQLTNKLESEISKLKKSSGVRKFSEIYSSIINDIENELSKIREQIANPIKDVFQGDKIDQATTSAKELDKTLEQVNIPTDSFDEVLSKLDLTKSELKEIVKITKQSVSDSEGKFHDSYTLKDNRGSTEIYGLSSNTEKGQLLRSNIVGYDAKEIEKEAKAQQKVAEQEVKALNQAWEEANKVNNALNETKKTLSSLPRMTELDTQFTSLDTKLSSLNSELTSGKISVADYKKEVKSFTSEYSKLVTIQQNRDVETYKQNVKAAEQEVKAVKRLNDELEGYNNQIPKKPVDGQRSDYFEGFVQKYKKAIDEARKYIDNLGDSPITEEVKKEWERLIDVIKKAKEEMDAVPNAEKGSDEASRTKEIDKLTKYLEKNTRISKEAREQLEGYLALLKSDDPSVNVKELHTAWTKVTVAEREAGREGKSFLDIFKNKVVYNYAAQLAGYYLSFMDIIRYAKQGVDAVKEFNDGLTKISYTMDMTKSKLNDLGSSVLNMASDMKSSVDDAMSVAQIYANMQTTAEEIQKLSEPTLILTNLSGFDSSTIADDIQAVNQQFDILAEDSMHIADVYDYISRNIAVDYSKGLNAMAEGLQVAGSTAKQAGKLKDLNVQKCA